MPKDWKGWKASVFKTIGASNHADHERGKEVILDYLNKRDSGLTEWRPVKGFEERFLINTNGDIFSLSTNRPMKICLLPNGYYYLPIMMRKPKKHVITAYVHRLVANTFIPNPQNKRTVNHKDGDKSNNRVSNLEWATQSEQNYHATRVLGHKRNVSKILAFNKNKRVFTDDEVRLIRKSELGSTELLKLFGKGNSKTINEIKKHTKYKEVR